MCLRIPRLTIRFPNFFFHDGTERPIQRPKDAQVQKTYYSGKKKQHTIKNNLVIPFLNNYIPFATFVKYLKLVIWAIAALV